MKKIFTILFISIISINLYAEDRYNRSTKNGVVVSTSFYASEVGAKILRDGGNATDATVATAFALAVTWPAAGNIGGGGFLIYHGINGENTSFDFREKAPLAAHKTMYLDKNGELIKNSNHLGLRSVGVPGSVAGLWDFHQKYGNLSWEKCLKPAIELAENGFPLTAALHRHIHKGKVSRLIKEYPSTRNIFLNESGKIISEGEIWIQKDLAQTLKRIQSKGKSGFYKGETAKILSKLMAKNGGIITKKDLNKYRAVERPVLTGNYKNYQILGMPAPSSGGTAIIEMLNMLETFELDEEKASARNTHIYTEVMRRAFADRAKYLGDPDFNPYLPLLKLLSKEHAKKLLQSYSPNRASISDSSTFNDYPESTETTHLSVIDAAGNAVSLTTTLENSYGCGIVAEGLGFFLNDEMGDFNPVPGVTNSKGQIGTKANLIQAEKRMLSSMSPIIILKDNQLFLVIGSPGGRTIINTVLQVILNIIEFDMTLAEAIESPRMHHQWLPDLTRLEKDYLSPESLERYHQYGHKTSVRGRYSQGRAMGILIDEKGMRHGAADHRSSDGAAVAE